MPLSSASASTNGAVQTELPFGPEESDFDYLTNVAKVHNWTRKEIEKLEDQTGPWTGREQFKDSNGQLKWYHYTVKMSELDYEEVNGVRTNKLMFYCRYQDGDHNDMYWLDDDDNDLLSTLDPEVLKRIRPFVARMRDPKKMIFG